MRSSVLALTARYGTGDTFDDNSEDVKNVQKRYNKPYEGPAQEPATVRCQLCRNEFSAKVVLEHSLRRHIEDLTDAQRARATDERAAHRL